MRRLAIVFAVLAAISAVEHIGLSKTLGPRLTKVLQTPRRIHRALINLTDWRAFLIGPLRLFQRATSELGQSN